VTDYKKRKLERQNVDWNNLAYDHSGRWEKNVDSIMNPGSKITWPQYVAEMVVFWRTQFLKNYQDIQRGPGWYESIAKHVRDLNQQATVICNYFPHPNDESLVTVAFRNYFRKNRPMKIGQYRKTRATEKNGKQVSNITQDEKDTVLGIKAELDRLMSQRELFIKSAPKTKEEPKVQGEIKFKTQSSNKKKSLADIMALEEKQLKKPS
jgi:hypothetical protein